MGRRFPGLTSFSSDANLPDYAVLHDLAKDTRLPDFCNPTVFHPTQAFFEQQQQRRKDRPARNGKQNSLNKGMFRAKAVLTKRRKAVRRFEENVDDTMSFGWKVGACMILLGIPWLGLPVMGAAAGINYASHYLSGRSCRLLDENLQDLELCCDPQSELADKQQALAKLRKTGRYLQLWEKFCDAGVSIGKFFFGEINRITGIIDMMFDVNKDLTKPQYKPQPTPSQSLGGALSQISYGLKSAPQPY